MIREFITYEWFTLLCITSLLFVTAAKYLFGLRFNDFLLVLGNSKYLKIYSKEQKFIDAFDGLLFANFTIGLSIFIHISYSHLVSPITFDILSFLKLLFAVSALFLIKVLIERLISSLFEIDAIIDSYVFQKTTFKNFSGLVLLIANLILLFGLNVSNIAICVVIIVFLLINSIGFITSFKNYQKLILANFFYFLLYLCALEIGPYIILYKAIKDYLA
ncbi:DUF4271 domain-containing protein [Winogradskyella immobilis]|uniref:DUF4271 domain-containing protein n=1 Tax=Winogradskyella immobilis TaxID=2816852 RepID=UPI001D0C77EA|nr:DUF4271 domain-containing protein [Winogradskyella immobilis]MCG0015133.1 DUF4271 domain-containing protein [Winogradskyella immobilis]